MGTAGRTRARRPSRVGVSVETRPAAEGGERFYARYTNPRGQRHVVKPPDGASTRPDWGEAFTAACLAQADAQRLSFRSRDGERLLSRDLVRDHYLPSLRDCSPKTRKKTASHLGHGRGLPTRKSPYGERRFAAGREAEVALTDLLHRVNKRTQVDAGRQTIARYLSSGQHGAAGADADRGLAWLPAPALRWAAHGCGWPTGRVTRRLRARAGRMGCAGRCTRSPRCAWCPSAGSTRRRTAV